MKKKLLSIMMVMALTIGTCGVAVAADTKSGATRNSLKSYGSIEYHNGSDKVVINADDLYMLADQIDQVKLDVTDQLEAMNTYFTAGNGISLNTDQDISVIHSIPSQSDSVNPMSVNFDTLLEGIAASQSVSLDVKDYGYPSETKLFKTSDGSLTTDGSEDGATEISVAAATSDNLSAGTVAWVNGELLLGTGVDNQTYYNNSNSELILNFIDVVYSGITKNEYYEMIDYIGNGFSTSASRRHDLNGSGTATGKHIGVRSVKFPVWDLDSESDKKLLNKITIQRTGSKGASATSGAGATSNTKYRVYTEDGIVLLEDSLSGVSDIVIEVMTLPISTQYIYVECESTPFVTITGSGSSAFCSVIMNEAIKATYLINS